MKIILASQSPRRRELLQKIGLRFEVCPSHFDEASILYEYNPENYCKMLAEKKAEKIAEQQFDSLIIGADTIVIKNKVLYPKPNSKNQAIQFLKELSGKTHQVYTGVRLISKQKNISHSFIEKTDVTFHSLSSSDIEFYVINEKPFDKAGGYGIQDFSSVFVKKIDGCYFNVVGFPLPRFYNEIKNNYPEIFENLLVTKMESL